MKTKRRRRRRKEEEEGEARAMSLLCSVVVVYCCKIQPCGRCQTCPNYVRVRVRVCVCVSDTIDACTHDTSKGKDEGGGATAALAYKKGHASATPTVNKSGHDSGLS